MRKSPKQRQGWSPQKKYATEDQILAEYYADRTSRSPTDPIADAMTDDDIRDLVNDAITG